MGNPVVGAARRLFRWDHQMDPRIAWVSPMPPARSGIASYSEAVLAGLERIGYTRRHKLEPVWPVKQKHSATIPWHTMAVYHLGNNVEFHGDIYDLAIRVPGLLVIHDLALDDFVQGMIATGHPFGYPALREGLLNAGRLARFEDAERNEPLRIPFIAHAARHARGIVAHSPFVERYLRSFGCRTPVFVAPHPVVERDEDFRAAERRAPVLRGSLETMGMRTLVGVFGDQNAAKLIDVVLGAVARLPEDVHVVLVGRRIPGYELEPVVRASGLGGRVSIHTDVSDEDFLAWMCAADVSVDLRHPHRGEVSGSLARSMQCGRPTIVSATGTYLDLRDDIVVHVPAGPIEPEELAVTLRELVDDPERRRRIGEAARASMAELARSEATAHVYAEAIDATLSLLLDPTRRALARWGGALVDIGVTEADLAEGYGVSYARALEEFRPPVGTSKA
ncbi:MAG: glycosyltransferase family 4 protein [Actinobacteria bacterium]|nr:glycosyltransferase family 4 protein [Actinomycetota bacterium]